MPVSSPTICIISFSPIDRDARVLRQLDCPVPNYDLVVLGYGVTPPRWRKADGVRWISVDPLRRYEVQHLLLRPTNYNHSIALPNKLFDFIHAGLAVCVGPSPGMAAFVRERRCGGAAPSFEPTAVAAALNRLGSDDIQTMRRAARAAAARINAAAEMAKAVDVCRRLLRRTPPIG